MRTDRGKEILKRNPRDLAFQMIGEIVNRWAMVDHSVDQMLIAYLWREGEIDKNEKKVSWSQLSIKLNYIKEILPNYIHEFSVAEKIDLCNRAAEMYSKRNDIIHGMVGDIGLTELTMVRWKVNNNIYGMRNTKVSHRDVYQIMYESGEFAKEFDAWQKEWCFKWPIPVQALSFL